MIVIENPNGRTNAGERAFIAHQRNRSGIALVNFMVGGGGPRKPGREVDVILILPRGLFAVEVKYTSAVGELDSPANDVWTVADVAHPFSSRNKSPAAQADQATKILASSLTKGPWPKGYITPAVAIHGNVTIPERVRWVGTVAVSTVEHFDLVVGQAKGHRTEARHVAPMLRHLGVGKQNIPTMEVLLEEGFAEEPPPPEPEASRSTGPDTAQPDPGPSKPRVLRDLSSGRTQTAALIVGGILALAGAWQVAGPVVGALAGAAMSGGLWLRRKVGGLTITEVVAALGVLLGCAATAPWVAGGSAWAAMAWLAALHAIGWPLTAMVLRDISEPLGRYLGHLRAEYRW